MERSLFDITLELQKSYSDTPLTVKRGDTHRTLRIRLCDGGRPYTITPGTEAVFTAVKPDGTHLYNACRVEKDTVFYDLTPQTTALPGDLECELRLYDEEGALLTTAAFRLEVADTVYADGDETVASSGEATALTLLVSEAKHTLALMEQVLANEVNHAVIDDAAVGSDAWSSKNIADKLCPGFTEKGIVVACDPLEGYPLEVVTAADSQWDSVTVTRCGKNLFDFKQPVTALPPMTGRDGLPREGYVGYAVRLPAGTYIAHCKAVGTNRDQYIYCVMNDKDGNFVDQSDGGDTHLKQGTKVYTRTYTFRDGDILYVYDGQKAHTKEYVQTMFTDEHTIQIEAGTVKTDYEPYRGQTFSAAEVDLEAGYSWPPIPALQGKNYLYSSCGQTSVTGRLDPKPLFLKEDTNG